MHDSVFKPSAKPLTIRGMIVRDVPAVLAIDKLSFTAAWKQKQLLDFSQAPGKLVYVAASPGGIAGYAAVERKAARVDLVRMAVHPKLRTQGVGRALMHELLQKLQDPDCKCLSAVVPEHNLSMLIFLRKLGFMSDGFVKAPNRSIADGVRMVLTRDEWIGGLVIERLLAGNARPVALP